MGGGIVVRQNGEELADIGVGCKNGDCGIIGGACFPAGTLIWAASGLKAIEEVKAEELVWAQDTKTGKAELKEVVKGI